MKTPDGTPTPTSEFVEETLQLCSERYRNSLSAKDSQDWKRAGDTIILLTKCMQVLSDRLVLELGADKAREIVKEFRTEAARIEGFN